MKKKRKEIGDHIPVHCLKDSTLSVEPEWIGRQRPIFSFLSFYILWPPSQPGHKYKKEKEKTLTRSHRLRSY